VDAFLNPPGSPTLEAACGARDLPGENKVFGGAVSPFGGVGAVNGANKILDPPSSSPFKAAGDSAFLPKSDKGARGEHSSMGVFPHSGDPIGVESSCGKVSPHPLETVGLGLGLSIRFVPSSGDQPGIGDGSRVPRREKSIRGKRDQRRSVVDLRVGGVFSDISNQCKGVNSIECNGC
jgi:hypothetical protein